MEPINFVYWIKGYFELNGPSNELTPTQVQIIKDHLDLVFKKETPTRHFVSMPFKPNRPCGCFIGSPCDVNGMHSSYCEIHKRDQKVHDKISGIDPKFMDVNWNPVYGYGQVVYNEHAISC